MARVLLTRRGMRTIALFLLLILGPVPEAVFAQEAEPPDGTRISSAVVSGLDMSDLSPGLREAIDRLAATPLSRTELHDLATRIESERPRTIAAVRVAADADGGARVTFVVARLRERDVNVNARYVVEDVDIRGVRDRDLSEGLQADRKALIGQPLDSYEADWLEARLKAEFPEHDSARRTVRGSRPGQIKVIYSLTRAEGSRWLPFEPRKSDAVYHSDQGWGALLDLPIGSRDLRVAPIVAWDHADDLVEEYSGFGVRVETRKLGTERLGASFEWSRFDQDWRDQTRAALALNSQIPGLYDTRSTITPLATFAITPQLRVSGGVSIVELEPLDTVGGLPASSTMANAVVGAVGYRLRRRDVDAPGHNVDALFTVRSAQEALESDLEYTRSLGQVEYTYRQRRHRVILSGLGGGITGGAPLFERFTLGDSRTLRGWDKYDIAPVGGDRVFHTSVEYRYAGLAMFLDAGSVWDAGTDRQFRVSTGFGYHPGPVFFTVGFPLNTDDLRAVFTMGLRLGAGSH